jgi:hypothetical protein
MSGTSSDAQFGVTVTGLQSSRQVAVAYIVIVRWFSRRVR